MRGVPVKRADPSNTVFLPLHQALENRYCQLHTTGVGTKQKQAEIVTLDKEDQLWQTGLLSRESPLSLLQAVF